MEVWADLSRCLDGIRLPKLFLALTAGCAAIRQALQDWDTAAPVTTTGFIPCVLPETALREQLGALAATQAEMAKHKSGRALQFGVLPWRISERGTRQVMLLSSRETRRWVIPKGWPMKVEKPRM